MSLQEQIKQLEERQVVMFHAVLVSVLVAIVALGVAFSSWRELDHIKSELVSQNARVTALTAEVRGVGG